MHAQDDRGGQLHDVMPLLHEDDAFPLGHVHPGQSLHHTAAAVAYTDFVSVDGAAIQHDYGPVLRCVFTLRLMRHTLTICSLQLRGHIRKGFAEVQRTWIVLHVHSVQRRSHSGECLSTDGSPLFTTFLITCLMYKHHNVATSKYLPAQFP